MAGPRPPLVRPAPQPLAAPVPERSRSSGWVAATAWRSTWTARPGLRLLIYGTLLAGGVAVVDQPADEGGQAPLRSRRLQGGPWKPRAASRARRSPPGRPPPSVKAVVADSAPEGVEGALRLGVDRERRARAARARHDPARPGGAHLPRGAPASHRGVMTHQSMVFAAQVRSRSTCGSVPTSASSACCRSRSTTAATSSS